MQQRGKYASTTIKGLFSAWSVPKSCLGTIGATQLVENQPVKRRLGGWFEMASSLGIVS
jgi:hypothetical protein